MSVCKYVNYLLALGFAAGLAKGLQAATTPVSSVNNGEVHLIDILGQSYGYTSGQLTVGTDANSPTITYSNGPDSITFTRISDSGLPSGNILLNGSNFAAENDAVWQDGSPQFTVEAKFARFNQTFGWSNLNNSGANTDILQVTDNGLNPASTTLNVVNSLSSSFLWYDTAGGNTWYSDPSLNGGEDHMATYWISGTTASGGLINSGLGAFLLAFEDLPFSISDKDYNDLVLQVSQLSPGGGGPPGVPLPMAVWGGLSMLGGLGGLRWMRRRGGG